MAPIYDWDFEGIPVRQDDTLADNSMTVNLPSTTYLALASNWDAVHDVIAGESQKPIRLDMSTTLFNSCQETWAKTSGVNLTLNAQQAESADPNAPGAPNTALNANRTEQSTIRGFGVGQPKAPPKLHN